MIATNSDGKPVDITNDYGKRYTLLNNLAEWPADTLLRAVGGYVVEDEGKARLMTLLPLYVLRDCSELEELHRDPTNVASAWTAGGYINVHLLPKTQGKTQDWGFLRDSTLDNTAGGRSHYISLYHDQTDDPAAFSGHLYISIPLDSVITPRTAADSIILIIGTFKQTAVWHFSAL